MQVRAPFIPMGALKKRVQQKSADAERMEVDESGKRGRKENISELRDENMRKLERELELELDDE